MENKKRFNSQLMIPVVSALVSIVFLVVGFTQYGFWSNQPQPGFFPIIIAVVLLLTSILCFFQILREKTGGPKYNVNELMVILGGAGIIVGTSIIGLIASCLLYLFLWLKFMEHAAWKHILIIEAVVGAIICVFVFWLQVRFPLGLLEYVF